MTAWIQRGGWLVIAFVLALPLGAALIHPYVGNWLISVLAAFLGLGIAVAGIVGLVDWWRASRCARCGSFRYSEGEYTTSPEDFADDVERSRQGLLSDTTVSTIRYRRTCRRCGHSWTIKQTAETTTYS